MSCLGISVAAMGNTLPSQEGMWLVFVPQKNIRT